MVTMILPWAFIAFYAGDMIQPQEYSWAQHCHDLTPLRQQETEKIEVQFSVQGYESDPDDQGSAVPQYSSSDWLH